MQHKNKKILSALSLTALFLSLVITPLQAIQAASSDLYTIYLDQAKEFEGNDYGEMMNIIKKRLYDLGTASSCPNFTKGTGKSYATSEEFTDAFTSLMQGIPSDCWTAVTNNAKLYDTAFYGHGKILEWYRDLNYSINVNAGQKPVDYSVTKEVKVEEKVPAPVAAKEQEPVKEAEQPAAEVVQPKPNAEVTTEVAPAPEATSPTSSSETVTPVPEQGIEAVSAPEATSPTPSSETVAPGPEQGIEAVSAPEADSNKNELPDDWEQFFSVDSNETASNDSDNDGLSNAQEFEMGSDPSNEDSDADGLSDNEERNIGTDPANADSDGDLVLDSEEIAQGGNPLAGDSNNDGLRD